MVPTLAAVITPAGDGSSHGKTFSPLLPAGLGARSEMLFELSGSLEGGETVACCVLLIFNHFIHLKRLRPKAFSVSSSDLRNKSF